MHRPVILAAGTPQILLPWDNAKVFQRNFEAYTAGQYASWTAWSAPATMSVADAARRVGMSEGDLRSVNTIPPRMLIKAGSVLIVPRTAKMNADVGSHVADNGQLSGRRSSPAQHNQGPQARHGSSPGAKAPAAQVAVERVAVSAAFKRARAGGVPTLRAASARMRQTSGSVRRRPKARQSRTSAALTRVLKK